MEHIVSKLRDGMNDPKCSPQTVKWLSWTIGAIEGHQSIADVNRRFDELLAIISDLNAKVDASSKQSIAQQAMIDQLIAESTSNSKSLDVGTSR